jgi:ribose transport system substrate-binding protein
MAHKEFPPVSILKRVFLSCLCIINMVFSVQITDTAAADTVQENIRSVVYGGPSSSHPYWFLIGNLVEEISRENQIAVIDLTPPDEENDPLRNRLFLEALDRNPDALIIGNYIKKHMKPSVDKAQQKNVPVIVIGASDGHPWIRSYVALDDYKSGQIMGEYIAKQTRGSGTALVLAGKEGYPGANERRDGAVEKMLAAGMKVIIKTCDWKVEKAFKYTVEELDKTNDISAIFGCWDPAIDTALSVVKSKNLLGRIILVGYDGLPNTLRSIRAGEINATISPPSIEAGTRSAMSILIDVLNKKQVPPELLLPGTLVTQDNVDNFLDDSQ